MSEVSPSYWVGYAFGILVIIAVIYYIVKYIIEKAKKK